MLFYLFCKIEMAGNQVGIIHDKFKGIWKKIN